MTQIFHSMIAAILGISEKQIGQTLSLLDDGATIPFISRYRKEMTGGLDEVQIESIRTHYEKLKETAKRKETIVATIREQGKMTPELQKRIDDTWDSTALEDIYLPYKPKRKSPCGSRPPERTRTACHPADAPARASSRTACRRLRERRCKGCGRCPERCARHHSRTGERERTRPQHAAEYLCTPSPADRQSNKRQRGGRRQIPGLLRLFGAPEAMQLAPPACHPPRRSGGSAQSEYQPQRRGVCGTAGTAVCTK